MHHSLHLQASWTKHGSESFLWEVLEYTSNLLLIAREQYWINAFDSADKKYGYNMCPTAGSTLGIKLKLTPEESLRRSVTIKGDKNPNKHPKSGKDHYRFGYRKSVCKYGHPRSSDNLNTQNMCRTCARKYSREYAWNKRHQIVSNL